MMLELVTVVSLLLAVIMGVVAWRVAHEERRRSAARVAALACDIHGDFDLDVPYSPAEEPAPSNASLFNAPAAPASGGRFAAALVAGVLVFASVAALVVVLGGASQSAPVAAAAGPAT